ncbi:tryptophan 2,3-dioxygenase family protein [Goodfellowiella coeruleoviolacea]|nr:tryptophan 2,3-dioxygenase family protein [Goodfellowiella coeruleoviolacea]
MTYSTYLHLDELLSLQHPLTPSDQQDVHDSERLFIVVHQASETLLSQVLTDLRHIEADRCTSQCFAHRVDRATRLIHALEGQLSLLHNTLRRTDFLLFRDRFGSASGLQSTQFRELFTLTERLTRRDVAHRSVTELEHLMRLRAAVQDWRRTHIKLVAHMIGDLPGSGNTSGIEYLARQLDGPAPGDAAAAAGPRTRS